MTPVMAAASILAGAMVAIGPPPAAAARSPQPERARNERARYAPTDHADPVPQPKPAEVLPIVGLIGNSTTVVPVSPQEADGLRYVPYSSVLRLPDGRLRYVPEGATEPATVPADDHGARAAIARDRSWLGSGTVPGRTAADRELAARALLDMRLLSTSGEAPVAAWYRIWKYVWPRDSSFAAVALTMTGHRAEALRILRFHQRTQRADGTWEARYHPDGSPVLDGRQWQLDGNGWVTWAAWVWFRTAPRPAAPLPVDGPVRDDAPVRDETAPDESAARELWPMVRAAAGHAAAGLRTDGLPPPGPDYWELPTAEPNIGTAAPLLAGLRASADYARRLGHPSDARRFADAAERLDRGIRTRFAPLGYPRTPEPTAGADAAVTFLAPPFGPRERHVTAAVERTAERLTIGNGGIIPGEDFPGSPGDAWTPETGFFALAAAASGRPGEARNWLDWIDGHRTALGAVPERVAPDGRPTSVAPLSWSGAIVLLTLRARDIPIPPPAGTDAAR
jgi:glucoamylase